MSGLTIAAVVAGLALYASMLTVRILWREIRHQPEDMHDVDWEGNTYADENGDTQINWKRITTIDGVDGHTPDMLRGNQEEGWHSGTEAE